SGLPATGTNSARLLGLGGLTLLLGGILVLVSRRRTTA
ncbi:MAG: LPXTG cell wall anchor domain-containing protein, partial [Actinobacteria bacterium]|nr:LPXTG cell wall anchor domain-containing protein [Actinomycetota bacterium]